MEAQRFNMNSDQEILSALRAAILVALQDLQQASPRAKVDGFALITDDDVSTLSGFAITADELTASADSNLLFSPTDWPREFVGEFDAADQLLRARPWPGPRTRKFVDSAFALLSDALFEAKQSGR